MFYVWECEIEGENMRIMPEAWQLRGMVLVIKWIPAKF